LVIAALFCLVFVALLVTCLLVDLLLMFCCFVSFVMLGFVYGGVDLVACFGDCLL